MIEVKNKLKARINRIKKYVGFKIFLPSLYKRAAKKPIDEKLVVFADARDREMPDNFVGLWELCEKNGYTCVEHSGRVYGKECEPRLIKKMKFKYRCDFMKLYARAKVVFLVEAYDLAYLVKQRPETQLIQLWHGCGLMKNFAYAASSKSWGISERDKKMYPMHQNYNLVCTSSERVRYGYHLAFQNDFNTIKAIGNPRTDIYFDENFKASIRNKVLELHPEIGNKKKILYAPTFRGKSVPKSFIKKMINYSTFKEELGEEYVLMIKFHPLLAKGKITEKDRLLNFGFIVDVTDELSPEEALCAADMLISDYSSIMFEYMLLERPIISYIYDIEEYAGGRGFFDKYEKLVPGPYVMNQEKLLEAIKTVDEWFDINRVRKYKEKYMSACDGHSTERIFNYVFDEEFRRKYDSETLPYNPKKH